MSDIQIFQPEHLPERILHSARKIAFVIGSGLAMPVQPETRGVPSANDIVRFIGQELDVLSLASLKSKNLYQDAFKVLLERRGTDVVNQIVRKAVLKARKHQNPADIIRRAIAGQREVCEALDGDDDWVLPPGLDALGQLLAKAPSRYCNHVLTSNFDPLIEVALRRYGAQCMTVACDRDVSLEHNYMAGYQVVHFHGYWAMRSTLHDPSQLQLHRRNLWDSFQTILSDRTVVVLGYGGWDDMFTSALLDVLMRHTSEPDVLWCFRATDKKEIEGQKIVQDILKAQESLHLVKFYCDVDANNFLPLLDLETPADRLRLDQIALTPSSGKAFDVSGKRPITTRNFATLWGVDRGSFIGILAGNHDRSVLATLERVEEILGNCCFGRFLRRTWIELDQRELHDPEGRIPRNSFGLTGVFIELGAGCDNQLLACVKSLRTDIESGRVAIVAQLVDEDAEAAADRGRKLLNRMKIANVPTDLIALPIAVNASVPGTASVELLAYPGKKLERVTYDDIVISAIRRQLEEEQPFSIDGFDESRMSSEMKAVCSYVAGVTSEDQFLRECGIGEFERAIRLGIEFPNAIELASRLSDFNPDIWWLLSRLSPTRRVLSQIVALPAVLRAVFGLITEDEWKDCDSLARDQVIRRREGRPICMATSRATV